MNELIKMSIDGRKNALYSSYDIKDEKVKEKIDNLFSRIYEFGSTFNDINDFETKFCSSSLNDEYINLFSEISCMCKPSNDDIEKGDKKIIPNSVKRELKYQARIHGSSIARDAVRGLGRLLKNR